MPKPSVSAMPRRLPVVTVRKARPSNRSAVRPVAVAEACRDLAACFLGNANLGRQIEFKLAIAASMSEGTETHGRPAIRRDKLVATMKAIQRVLSHLDTFPPQMIADALGRVAPGPLPIDAAEEVILAAAVPSRAPALLTDYDAMVTTLKALHAGLPALAGRGDASVRRGRSDTPDSLMFAIEGLAALWREHTGATTLVVSRKAGGFGDFVTQALALCAHRFSASQVQTALRRLQEERASQG